MASHDALNLLVNALAGKLEVRLLDGSKKVVEALRDAETISLPSSGSRVELPRATVTRYRKPGSTADTATLGDPAHFFDLQSLLLLYLFRDQPVAEYLQEVGRTPGATVISVLQKRDVLAYLLKERAAGDEIVEEVGGSTAGPSTAASADASSSRPAKKARYTVDRNDLELVKKFMQLHDPKQLTDRERVLRGHKPVVRGVRRLSLRTQSFSTVTALVAPRIQEASAEAKRLNKGGAITQAAKPVADSSQKRKRNPNPIIIVSPSSSALLTMYNIKRFLEDGVFETSEQARVNSGARTADDVLVVNHKRQAGIGPSQTVLANSANGSTERTIRYFVVDGAEALSKFGDEAWDRVCCVFTTGQEWQFRPYKWSEPKELFHHVKGVCFQYTNERPDPKIRAWNVAEFKIDPTKRHTDKSTVAAFWRTIEEHIALRQPSLSGAAGL